MRQLRRTASGGPRGDGARLNAVLPAPPKAASPRSHEAPSTSEAAMIDALEVKNRVRNDPAIQVFPVISDQLGHESTSSCAFADGHRRALAAHTADLCRGVGRDRG